MLGRRGAACVLAFILVSCGSKDLDRGTAKTLIQQAKDFGTVKDVTAKDDALGRAIKAGIVKSRPFQGFGAMLGNNPTGSGPWMVDGANDDAQALFVKVDGGTFALRDALHRTVTEVTGITDGSQPGITKIAQFHWHFTDLSEPIYEYTGVTSDDHDGEASFRKYDDGWRVENVKIGDMFNGGNSLPLKKVSREPLELVGAYQGQDVTTPTMDVFPPRHVYVEIWRRPQEPAKVFGYFVFDNHPRRPVIEKFDGTYDAKGGTFALTDRVEGNNYTLKREGDALNGSAVVTSSKNLTVTLTMTRAAPPNNLGPFYSIAKWEKAHADTF